MNPLRSLLITCIFLRVTSDEIPSCPDSTDYTSDNFYGAHLNTLLRTLSSNVGNSGFYNASDNGVNANALCRGDIQPGECRSCIDLAVVVILQLCANQMQAIIWKEFCTLRYSNESIFGTLATSPSKHMWSPLNVMIPDEFKEVRRTLIDDLRGQAANGSALRKAAAGSRAAPDNLTIYAMVQCTPDLTVENCTSCFVQAAQDLTECCDDKIGARSSMPSCFIRYENYAFYNITRLQEPLEPTSSPPSSKGKNDSTRSTDNNSTRSTYDNSTRNIDDNSTRNIIIIVISTVMGLILTLFVGIFTIKRIRQKAKENPSKAFDDISNVESIQYDFDQIRAATNDFSDINKLGQGGFGAVYKGKLLNGREIAVKRLSQNSGQGDLEFKNEVLLVARLQHRNLARLLGFSLEGRERLLIYEFHQNGSLDHWIFDPIKSSYLNWEIRNKIIRGIARGLLYLHEDSRLRIIHRDLKASNVLLDEEMNPKISDFGMAKLIMPDVTHESTSRVVGTYGYMAPEYAIHGQLSIKSDVYSFGVLVLEIISGKKKVHFQNSEDLLSYAWRSWRGGSIANLIDPVMRATSGNQVDLLRCIHIALLCVQENATDRPTMASVIQMFNSYSSTLPLPSEPAFYVSTSSSESTLLLQKYNSKEESSSSSKSKLAQATNYSSNNDISITKLHPR